MSEEPGRTGEESLPEGPTNRLAAETSPYLLLHRHNPVDWYAWGEEAIARARREDKPIFLSVGYSTCFWCHVMERESFSDPRVAAAMNRDFVNVKVDREERPDIDEIYMTATQILAQQGGWPNSVFLTPDLKPFFAGTYFPPDDRHGRPGFAAVLRDLAEAWRSRRREVEEQAEEMARAMRRYLEERAEPAAQPPGADAAARAVDSLARRFDRQWGGFGAAPKFPTPANLFLLLELADERPEAGEMLAATLDAMARGGIYDQLAGGFHRYATDREWKVPHFEKMLYDNGLLLEIYAREYARSGDAQAARVARQTAEWLAREMTSPEGALWSAVDAETRGHEGAYYVWTRQEIDEALGEEDATFLAPLLGFADPPFFEGESYVLHLPERLEEQARRRRMPLADLLAELGGPEARLLAARSRRERPATDDKILADWNGMAIGGLAVAGELLGEPGLTARAARAADFVLERMRPGGAPLLHSWRAGQGKIAAYLGDYAFLVRGLLALHRASGEARWLTAAAVLAGEQAARLGDPAGGFFVAGESPDVLFRSKEVFDGAIPSGNAIAILNLLELAEATGEAAWLRQAEAALRAFAPLVEIHPDAVRMLALAARRYHRLASGQATAAKPAGKHVPSPRAAVREHEKAEISDEEHRRGLAAEAAHEREPSAGGIAKISELAEHVVTPRLSLEPARDGGWRSFRLALEIAPGWHIQANPAAADFLVATTLTAEGADLRNLHYPPGQQIDLAFADHPLAVYLGSVELTGDLRATGEALLLLTYQPCDHARCLPSVTRPLPIE